MITGTATRNINIASIRISSVAPKFIAHQSNSNAPNSLSTSRGVYWIIEFCTLIGEYFREYLSPAQNHQVLLQFNSYGVPGWIRTSGLSLRRRTLYPAELREHTKLGFWIAGDGLSRKSKPPARSGHLVELRIVTHKRLYVVAIELRPPVEKGELHDE